MKRLGSLKWLAAASAVCTQAYACTAPGIPIPSSTSVNHALPVLMQADNDTYPDALCNDGTKPVFQFSPALPGGRGVNRWLIWHEGGGQCQDAPTCAAQAPKLLTATGWIANKTQEIMSNLQSANPYFYDANKVVIHYCSSDLGAGDKAASIAKFYQPNLDTWTFKGRRIIQAVLSAINGNGTHLLADGVTRVHNVDLGLRNASDVIFGGSSAGGVAATLNINDDLLLLAPPGSAARITLANDAGFINDFPAFDILVPAPHLSPASPDLVNSSFAVAIVTWNGRGDALCDIAAGGPENTLAHRQCFFTGNVMANWISVPAIALISQLDSAQLHDNLWPVSPFTPLNLSTPTGSYANGFALGMANTLRLPPPVPYSFYAPQVLEHEQLMFGTSNDLQVQQFPEGMISPQQAFNAWYASDCTVVAHLGNARWQF